MSVSSGKTTIDGIGLDSNIFRISNITSTNAALSVYSDKLKPPAQSKIKPLPVAALKKAHFPLQIDSLHLNNMAVNYTELNAKTKHTGHVYFTHVKASIQNINFQTQTATDSLRINASANFLDTLPVHIVMNESYIDSLNGLSMQLQLGHGDMRVLNPVCRMDRGRQW